MKSRWQFYERAQQGVYRKLKARERPEAVVGAGWGFLDHFFIFLFSLGFFARVDFRGRDQGDEGDGCERASLL